MFLIPIIVGTIAFAVLAPIVGCLLAGLDRKLSARMQGRVGPPILQPYYDVRKLLEKDRAAVNSVEGTYITCALAFAVLAGGIFFGGGNLLLSVFVLTLSSLFFILAAYCTRSPYSEVGAAREALQIMAEEPMSLFIAVAFFLATGSFDSAAAFALDAPAITVAWLAFLGFLFILTIKMRKSPFDLSYSHHAHQELVKGVTTEMSGRTLAKVEVMHWCENVLCAWLDRPVLRVGQPRLHRGGHRRSGAGVFPGDSHRQQLRPRQVAADAEIARGRWHWWPAASTWPCWSICKERLMAYFSEIAVGHPLRCVKLQRLRHRGACGAVPGFRR